MNSGRLTRLSFASAVGNSFALRISVRVMKPSLFLSIVWKLAPHSGEASFFKS